MKKLLILACSIGLAFGAFAQKRAYRGGHHSVRPRVMIGIGGGFGYSPYYSPYSRFNSPYGPYDNYNRRPSRLDLQIEDIKLDYSDKIKSVRMDDGIKRREKRQRIRDLKYDRDEAVINAKKNYYYHSSRR